MSMHTYKCKDCGHDFWRDDLFTLLCYMCSKLRAEEDKGDC